MDQKFVNDANDLNDIVREKYAQIRYNILQILNVMVLYISIYRGYIKFTQQSTC